MELGCPPIRHRMLPAQRSAFFQNFPTVNFWDPDAVEITYCKMRKQRDGYNNSPYPIQDHNIQAAGGADHQQQQQHRNAIVKEWQVILFRRTVSRGWEVYFPNGMDSVSKNNAAVVSTTNNKKKGGKNVNNSSHQQKLKQPQWDHYIDQQLISVTPKNGCIEMKQLRLRIPLSSSTTSKGSSSGGNGNDNNAALAANTSAVVPSVTVTRRMDTILLTTSRGGCIVLKFTSLESCLSFWDELVLLNTTVDATAKADDGDDNYEHSNNPSKHLLDLASRKKQRYDRESTSSNANNITTSKYSSDYKYEEFRSMLIRLLHEEDFMDFVNELDDCLTSNADGASMLQNAAATLLAKVHPTM